MPELPWDKWFATNWAAEPGLKLCCSATRGIWMEALNTMMLWESYKVEGDASQIAKLLNAGSDEILRAVRELSVFKVADISEQNGNIIIVNRKRKRDCEIRDIRAKAGRASGTKRRTKVQHAVRTRSASASASASASVPGEGSGERPSVEEVKAKAVMIGLAEWKAEDWYHEMEACGWLDYSKRPIANWISALTRVKTKWEADGRPSGPPATRNGVNGHIRPTDQLREVEEQIRVHVANPQSIAFRRAHTELEASAYQILKNTREALKRSIAAHPVK